MKETLKEFGLDKKARSYSVITQWADVVGETLAKETQPEKLDKGVLTVKVPNNIWKQELNMRKREILAKLQRAFPGEVTEINWK